MSQQKTLSEFRIRGLAPTPPDGCVMLLEEVGGARLLPIHTGAWEAQSLMLEVSGVARSRPLTHDLLVSVVTAFGWGVKRIVVTEVKDSVFYARIIFEKDGEEKSIDARPSDALNVAVRAKCPIYVEQCVFEGSEPILKPIEKDELARFREQLESADLSKAFEDLEGKPAPKERGDEKAPEKDDAPPG